MSPGDDTGIIRRILVAVDAALASNGVVEAAARVAACFNAQLLSVYVEDINLLRLAGLPFTREVTWSTASELKLDYQRMERVLRSRGAQVQQTVTSLSTQLKIQGSVTIVRGQVVQELVQAAGTLEADLLIVGKGHTRSGRLGSVARQITQFAPCTVMLIAPPLLGSRESVLVHFAERPQDHAALLVAARWARCFAGRLIITLPLKDPAQLTQWQRQIRENLGEGSLSITYHAQRGSDHRYYERLIQEEKVGLVVLSASVQNAADLERRIVATPCSTLILR